MADAYRSVDRATRAKTREPLWLPAGWLAVVLMLTAAAPSLGADGWRARGSVAPTGSAQPVKRSVAKPSGGWGVRQVGWQDDLAGPALRTAGRLPTGSYDGEYRVAQNGDPLRDSFERPFGVEDTRPADGGRFDPEPDADTADRLFDDLPEEPAHDPEPEVAEPDHNDSYNDDAYEQEQRTPPGRSLFDDDREVIRPGVPTEPGDLGEAYDDRDDDRDDDRKAAAERRSQAMQDCSQGLAELKANRLDAIDLSIRVTGAEGEDYPTMCTLDDGAFFTPRCWGEITYTWKASGLCHKPLYFEDEHLERYGHSWGPYLQPLVSGAHFFGTLPVLPYKMGLKTPNECVYTLGHYRPGDCAPYLIDPIPFTWRAALFEAGAAVGVSAILP